MSNLVSFKVYLTKHPDEQVEVRRFGIEQDVAASFTYLVEKLKTVFPCLQNTNQLLHLYWKDSDNDEVAISSDAELIIALTEIVDPIKKIYIKPIAESYQDDAQVFFGGRCQPDILDCNQHVESDGEGAVGGDVHVGVVCDGCEGPVVGFRYKCVQCSDYDLCSSCEAKCLHAQHMVLRIPTPASRISGVKVCVCSSKKKGKCCCEANWSGRGGDVRPEDVFACPAFKKHSKKYWKHHGIRSADCPRKLADAVRQSLKDTMSYAEANTSKRVSFGDSDAQQPTRGATARGGHCRRPVHGSDAPPPRNTPNENAPLGHSASAPEFDLLGDLINILPPLLKPLQVQGFNILNEILTGGRNNNNNDSTPNRSNQETQNTQPTECQAQEKPADTASAPKEQTPDDVKTGHEKPNGTSTISDNGKASSSNAQLDKVADKDIDKLATDVQQLAVDNDNIQTSYGNANAPSAPPTDVESPRTESPLSDDYGIRVKAINVEQREAEDGWTLLNQQQPNTSTDSASNSNSTGAIPKTTNETLPNEKQQQTKTPELPSYYPVHVKNALHRMLAMGFSNEGNWLGELLYKNNGDVGAILDLLLPAKRYAY